MTGPKTDNHNPAAKLALRRHFLAKYHADTPPAVLDCCQATGRLWLELRKEFKLLEYWGVDLAPKKGRLKIDSVRILDQPGWRQSVVDIDTYGSPWRHWFALLRNCDHSVTVFLTIGIVRIFGGGTDLETLRVLGLDALFAKLKARGIKAPAGVTAPVRDRLGLDACISAASESGFEITECVEADNAGGNARYIGVRLTRR